MFYGGPIPIQPVTSNRKTEETITLQNFAYFNSLF